MNQFPAISELDDHIINLKKKTINIATLASEMDNRVGLYILALHLSKEHSLTIGKFGRFQFPPGYYQYIGSAGKGIRFRVIRHLERRSVRHWHLDYLMPFVSVFSIRVFYEPPFTECSLAAQTEIADSGIRFPPRFGASDCRCSGHLIRHDSPPVWDKHP